MSLITTGKSSEMQALGLEGLIIKNLTFYVSQ
jgi:hypothetical protein